MKLERVENTLKYFFAWREFNIIWNLAQRLGSSWADFETFSLQQSDLRLSIKSSKKALRASKRISWPKPKRLKRTLCLQKKWLNKRRKIEKKTVFEFLCPICTIFSWIILLLCVLKSDDLHVTNTFIFRSVSGWQTTVCEWHFVKVSLIIGYYLWNKHIYSESSKSPRSLA